MYEPERPGEAIDRQRNLAHPVQCVVHHGVESTELGRDIEPPFEPILPPDVVQVHLHDASRSSPLLGDRMDGAEGRSDVPSEYREQF